MHLILNICLVFTSIFYIHYQIIYHSCIVCTFYSFYSDISLIQYNKLEYCFECVPKHPQGWLPNVLSRTVDLLENALYAVPSVEGYAISCVLCNMIIIPNVWASLNINMSHMYIDQSTFNILQPAFIPPPPPRATPVYMVTWLTSFAVILQYCAGYIQACTCIWKRRASSYSAFRNFSKYCTNLSI